MKCSIYHLIGIRRIHYSFICVRSDSIGSIPLYGLSGFFVVNFQILNSIEIRATIYRMHTIQLIALIHTNSW